MTRFVRTILLHCMAGAVVSPFGLASSAGRAMNANPGQDIPAHPRFSRLSMKDGLALDNVVSILQDHRGFMWFGTGDGLSRFDGISFVTFKNNPGDPGSLSANFIRDLVEDDRGQLWLAVHPGVNRFDPTTERSTRYLHDPKNPNSLSGDSVWSVTRDRRGHLWFATADSGLDRFDPATETFTHYRTDSEGQFVGWLARVIEGRNNDIWFVGNRGLFHLDLHKGPSASPELIARLAANDVYQDEAGDIWMLVRSPIIGLVKYERRSRRLSRYPLGVNAALPESCRFLSDGENGFWVASSLGLSYFDRRAERFTRLFQHTDADPGSLSDNNAVRVYRDRAGLLWVGTQSGGVNILDFQQEQFRRHLNRSGGKLTSMYKDANGDLWLGVSPRALVRLDEKSGALPQVPAATGKMIALGGGGDLGCIARDAAGFLWVGGWGAGLDRLEERTGRFQHYRHDPADPHSLQTDDVVSVYPDPSGALWVGVFGGASRFDPATGQFKNFRPGPPGSTALAYTVSAFHRDRSGALWLGTWGGVLSRYDEKSGGFVNYTPDLRDPKRLQGGSIGAIHEDREGSLWLASGQGLYRFNRQNETFTRFTEAHGLPNVDVMGILEDEAGKLWISTKKGISRFDPLTGKFRNYDVSNGLHSNEFTRSCYQRGRNGEMLFCGSTGITSFFPGQIRDSQYVPPIAITGFRIFNKPVPIGPGSALKKAIPYLDALTLPYRDNVITFEFAALSFANPQKNRYRFTLEGFDPGWSEVDSKQRVATYTNLDPANYVFRVQGSNSDGLWNETGVSLPVTVTPPWYRTGWAYALFAATFLALLWGAYQFRVGQLRRDFKKLRDVIETIPGYVWSAKPDGSVDFINKRWLEFSGLSLEQAMNWGWKAAIHPEDRDRFVEAWRSAFTSGQAMEAEVRVRRADGQYRWLLVRNVPLRDKAGQIVKWYGKSADIDDRKRAEQALRRSEAYLAGAQRLTGTGAWATDGTARPLYWSEEVFRIFGFDPAGGLTSAEEVLQRVHPEDRERFLRAFQRSIQEKVDSEVEYRAVLPDGTVKHLHALAHPVLDSDRELLEIVGTVVDVTGQKHAADERERLRELETELAHINRLSIMGELSASIAHEVNQPLSGVVSNGNACLRWLSGDLPNLDEAREAARRIVRDGKRAGDVISRIRSMTKRAAPPRETLNLNETIQEVLDLVGDKARKEAVAIRTQFDRDLAPVSGDRVQLQQVVLNLVMNAIEALGSTKERARNLVITTRRIEEDWVQVSVQDSGPGIDPDALGKIFDPFYTTKADGMGMGLSICRSIIQTHGGRLWATANDGPGTSFHFALPGNGEEGRNAADTGA